MKKINFKLTFILFVAVMFFMPKAQALAAPHFTITPTAGTYSVGSTFAVTLGVDSDVEKVVAMDVVGAFDKDLLELISVDKITTPDPAFQFSYDANTAIIHNDTGKFEVTLSPVGSSVFDGVVAKQNLLTLYFRPKASGTGTLNLLCVQGAVNDSNILNPSSVDVDSCTANQSGSYTIQPGVGGVTTTPAPTSETTPVQTTESTELPRTGAVGTTVGLIVFGAVSVLSALFLRLL